MRKTTVYIDENDLRAIRRLAKQRGRPEAELIRDAIAQYARNAQRPTFKSLGFVSGPGNLADRVEESLADGFGE